jgi:ankyrin repeat protein
MIRQPASRADLNSNDEASKTQLPRVELNWHEAMVKLLLEKGIDPNSKDKNGQQQLSRLELSQF